MPGTHSPLSGLVEAGIPIRRIVDGFRFTEGPVWHPKDRHLTFSDIPSSRILRLYEDGTCATLAQPSSHANGNAYDREGRLVTCEHATSRIVRREADGRVAILADAWQGRELNSPNDLTVARDGTIYFTDPPYGRLSRSLGGRRPIPQPVNGVYRLDSRGLSLMASDFEMPNGLCLTPAGRSILIADTAREHIRLFDIAEDGSWHGGSVWVEVPSEGMAAPDGLKCDSEGNIYCSGAGGIHVFDAAARHRDMIEVPELVANFVHGGADMKTLFITASTSIYSVRVKVAGMPAF